MKNKTKKQWLEPCLCATAILFASTSLCADANKPQYPLWDGKETIEAYCERAGVKPTLSLDVGGGIKMGVRLIPAGEFQMGSTEAEQKDHDETRHKVKLTKPFYLGKCEVTQAQYEKVMGKNPSKFKGDDNPVDTVSWNDAQEFCKRVGTTSGQKLRLPTEAEWEFACRAGTETCFYTGDDQKSLEEAAWFDDTSGETTHPVGLKKPNAWGLYDMHGNVTEWCQDQLVHNSKDAAVDPVGEKKNGEPVLRGGSWDDESKDCRSARRDSRPENYPTKFYGFRVVVILAEHVADENKKKDGK